MDTLDVLIVLNEHLALQYLNSCIYFLFIRSLNKKHIDLDMKNIILYKIHLHIIYSIKYWLLIIYIHHTIVVNYYITYDGKTCSHGIKTYLKWPGKLSVTSQRDCQENLPHHWFHWLKELKCSGNKSELTILY